MRHTLNARVRGRTCRISQFLGDLYSSTSTRSNKINFWTICGLDMGEKRGDPMRVFACATRLPQLSSTVAGSQGGRAGKPDPGASQHEQPRAACPIPVTVGSWLPCLATGSCPRVGQRLEPLIGVAAQFAWLFVWPKEHRPHGPRACPVLDKLLTALTQTVSD
jgi:hypothetical protein